MPAGGAVAAADEIGTSNANICAAISPNYVSLLPVDPDVTATTGGTNGAAVADCAVTGGYVTGYYIVKDTNGRLTVWAPGSESVRGTKPLISVTR